MVGAKVANSDELIAFSCSEFVSGFVLLPEGRGTVFFYLLLDKYISACLSLGLK